MKGAIGRLSSVLILLSVALLALAWSGGDAGAATTYVDGDWTITESTTLEDGTWWVNGSVAVQNGTLRLEDAELVVNSTIYDNTLTVAAEARLEAIRSTIRGGEYGLFVRLDNHTLLDNTTVRNLDTYNYGYGLYHTSGGLVLDHCTLEEGYTLVYSYGSLTVRSCQFASFSSSALSWTYTTPETGDAFLLVEASGFEGVGPSGYGVSVSGPGTAEDDCWASIRGCTFEGLYRAVGVYGFLEGGPLVVEDNVASECHAGCYISGCGPATTFRRNTWGGTGYEIIMQIQLSYDEPPVVNNETIRDGQAGVYVDGYYMPLTLWDMNVTDVAYGIYTSSSYVDVRHSYVRGTMYDFAVSGSGRIHLFDVDHTYKGHVSYYSGEVLEAQTVNITSVTWQDGTPIEEGVVHLENETGYQIGIRDNEEPEPVTLPLWLLTSTVNITVERAVGAYATDGLTFRSEPVAFRGVTHMVLVIVDNSTPEIVVQTPRAGGKSASDAFLAKGTYVERGAGMGTVRARYDDGDWKNASVFHDGTWQYRFRDLPDGLLTFRFNITDRAGNSLEVEVVNVTIDTVCPFIIVQAPPMYVRTSPVRLIAQTEPGAKAFVDHAPVDVMPDGMFSAILAFHKADNNVHIRVVDVVGHENQTIYKVIYDTEAPSVFLETPEDRQWTVADSVCVNGTTELSAEVDVNGYKGELVDGRFSIVVPLAEGVNTLAVRVLDRAGNAAVVTRTVLVDRTRPELTIGSPADGTLLAEDWSTVQGEVLDDNPVTVWVGDLMADLVDGDWFREVRLVEGTNVIRVVAEDLAGNRESATVTVHVDLTPPVVRAQMVVDNVTYGPGAGTVLTSSHSLTVELEVSEAVDTWVHGNWYEFTGPGNASRSVMLEPGRNVIEVRAQDRAGHTAEMVVFTVVHDADPPALEVTSQDEVLFTRDDHVLVRGLTEPGCEVSVDGMSVPVLGNGSFALLVPLEMGPNYLRLVARDAAGNEAGQTLQVVRRAERDEDLTAGTATFSGALGGLIAGLLVAAVVAVAMARRQRRALEAIREEMGGEEGRAERPGTGPPSPPVPPSPPEEPPSPPPSPPGWVLEEEAPREAPAKVDDEWEML